jgi:uncharacterized RDD family membrane protein YckC
MPIPALPHEELSGEARGHLRLVESPGAAAARPAFFYARFVAHVVDVCVLGGFSVYLAKISSIFLISLHGAAISSSGKAAAVVFRQAFDYSSAQLFSSSFAALSLLYFVGLPMVFGRTPGQGILGLRIWEEAGEKPSLRALILRLFGVTLTYASGGLLCLVGLRQRDGRFLQDILSRSRVAKDV